ncbi:hypothetical protein [Catellatospora sp. NPDC049609]|uniref:hypothetical protein n=1 Tax=Catellatospora sp. NPDC049609 TaxID=3155505 RepID=UPI00342EDE91
MAAPPKIYHQLDCDSLPADLDIIVEDCEVTFVDHDTEGAILCDDAAQLRAWATDAGWIRYSELDICGTCRSVLAKQPHLYLPKPDNTCRVCKGGPLDADHTNIQIAGQTAIPTAAA